MQRFSLLLLLVLFSITLAAQTTDTTYAKRWLDIDTTFFNRGLTRSALTKVNSLYQQAKKDKRPAQVTKALLYRMYLEQNIKEYNVNEELALIKKEIAETPERPARSVLMNILAQKYQQYYERERYRIFNRTNTGTFKEEDIATWTVEDLHKVITHWYQQSLLHKQALQQQSITRFDALLNQYNSKVFRPTLYDLLAHHALEYFKNENTYLTQPAYAFKIDQPEALGDIDAFLAHTFTSRDSASNQWKALLLYQDLIRFHLRQQDTAALIHVNLERLNFARTHSILPGKDSLFYLAVQETATRFAGHKYAAEAWYLLAAFHADNAARYRRDDKSARFEYVKAISIIQPFIPLTDSTPGHYQLYNLYQSITREELGVQAEEVNVPGMPFRVLVNFKNVDTMYYRIIRAPRWLKDTLQHYQSHANNSKSIYRYVRRLPFITASKVALPSVEDYQSHTVEVKMDALANGGYYLLASATPTFTDTAQLALLHLTVSNISFVRNGQNMFVLDRTSGQPLPNAGLQVYEYRYNRSLARGEFIKKEKYKSDNNGYIKLNTAKDGGRNLELEIYHNGDTLYTGQQQYIHRLTYNNYSRSDDYENDEAYEEDNARMFYFTDRSIYRPGQKVHFKLIMLTRDKKTGAAKLYFPPKEDSTYIFLHDANRQKIDSLAMVQNEYGSFAGSFTLPASAMTGSFSLQSDNVYDETGGEFSVEEYKRPTFEVNLQKPVIEYKLGDPIIITGTAKAYAGNAADGALVKYSVTRRGRFMYPWLYRGIHPVSSEMVIAHGETITGADGNFTIHFPLVPDEKISRSSLPVFDYQVTADVTSNAGETRSNVLVVSAGYHSLNVQLNVKTTEDVDSLKQLFVNTTNVSGAPLPAVVRVSIIPLQAPTNLLRKRYWAQPDTTMYSREQYKQWFPNDEYANEADKTTWQRSAAVYSTTINTKDSNKVLLPQGAFRAGWYVVEAIATDNQGIEIKDQEYIQLYSRRQGSFAGNDYFFTSAINNYVAPGEAATFLIGSSAPGVFIIQEVQQKPAKKATEINTTYSFHQLDRNVKTVSIVPALSDDALTVNFVMVKDNRVYTWNQQVVVQRQQDKLDIDVTSYRNKLEPGAKETWTVKISGTDKDAVAAEVMTSMYDASLDQFKQHNWTVPALQQQLFYGTSWYQQYGFRSISALVNHISQKQKDASIIYPRIQIDMYGLAGHQVKTQRFTGAAVALEGKAAGLQSSPPSADMEEVVVTGFRRMNRAENMSASPVRIRGVSTVEGSSSPLIIVDGVVVASTDDVNPDDITSTTLLQGDEATAIYGARAANGVLIITTKSGAAKQQAEPLKVRTNFSETAFFFPQLRTNAEGSVSFTFTLPEALTQWKWQVLSHTKNAAFGLLTKSIVSQKTLMVQMNAPRFLRQGDQVELSARISNLDDKEITGTASLQLFDAVTGEAVDQLFSNTSSAKSFSVSAGQSNVARFAINVPADFTNPVTWRVVARSASYSDGEENTIPVLSKRMLVTETLPFLIRGAGKKVVEMPKLLNNTSSTLQHHALTVEYTAEPVWYAIQSLPYLAEFPYECSEQVFNRLFANALAAKIVNQHPRIRQVFEQWMKTDTATGETVGKALLSLQRNEELKNILLQETPWVLQAQSEAQQQKNIAMLFDVVKMSQAFATNIEKLKQMQMESGGFPWFKGGNEDRYITQYILTGIGRLKKMNAIPPSISRDLQRITRNALEYLDIIHIKKYEQWEREKVKLKDLQLSYTDIQYLYMRSLFSKEYPLKNAKATNFYTQQSKQQWNKQSTYFKAMIAAALHNAGDRSFVMQNILPSLLENAVIDSDSAMYWKDMQRGFYWYQAPVEQQALIMELINDVYTHNKITAWLNRINDMKTWLLKQKQTNHWSNTKSTADACYALVATGGGSLPQAKQTTITVGSYNINTTDGAVAGAGYIKERIPGKNVNPDMGKIEITSNGKNISTTPSWGAVYWQYFEDMDKITPAVTPLSLEKKLFIEVNTTTGKELRPVNDGDALSIGDRLKVRIILRSDRDMEYIHLKDMRAAGSEPVNVLSSYKWQDGLGYYESTRDAATNFFIDRLPRGTYVFEYPLFISHSGNFSVGIATAQCMYAPEFSSHSAGIRVSVK